MQHQHQEGAVELWLWCFCSHSQFETCPLWVSKCEMSNKFTKDEFSAYHRRLGSM